jgi:hypothetical protein
MNAPRAKPIAAEPAPASDVKPPRKHPALLWASGVLLVLWLLALGWLAWHG